MAPVNRNKPERSASSDSTYSLMEFTREYPDDASCLDFLWRENFAADGERAYCPKCEQQRKFHRIASRPSYSCDTCGHHLHPTAGTIFHKSSTSLHLWFYAIFMMSSTRCGVSAKHLERELGVTYKTAWRMAKLIREQLMAQDDDHTFTGDVEMDETSIGPRTVRSADHHKIKGIKNVTERMRAAQKMSAERKTTVFGVVERGGKVRAEVVTDRRAKTLLPIVQERVLPSAVVFTDEWKPYDGLTARGYEHHRIRHESHVYVDGNVHTQTIEGFWSLVKNGIRGTHHSVSAKHLQGYLNGYVWRYNHRDDRRPMFLTLLESAARPVDLLGAG